MKFWHWFVASGFIALLLNGCGGEQSTAKVGKQAEGDLVLISYEDEPGNATGFFVAGSEKACTVLTARHALPASGKLKLQTPDQKLWKPTNIKRFPTQDLAVVTFNPGEQNCPYNALKLGNSDLVKLGDYITLWGFPEQQNASRLLPQSSSGEVTAVEKLPDGYGISYQTAASGGMIGGPVVNAAGEVIAVHGRSDGEIVRLAEFKGGKLLPQKPQPTQNAKKSEASAQTGSFKWGIPINSYLANMPKVPGEDTANSPATVAPEEWVKIGNDLYVSKRYKEAINAYDKAIKIKPDYVVALLYKGGTQLELNRYQNAADTYKKAAKIKPDSTVAWSNLGLALDHLQEYEDAIAAFDKAIKLKADSPEVLTGRCYALAKLKRYQEAISSCDKAIQLHPDYADAWNNQGYALDQAKQYDAALASFEKAIQFQPDNTEAWANRGLVLEHLERYSDAVASYDKAIQLESGYPKAWYGRGNALFKLNLYSEAVASYNKAIQFQQNYPEAWYGRGNALSNLKQYKDAVASYDKAIKFKQNYPDAWNSRGAALAALQQYKAAVASYDKALEMKEDDSQAWNNRGLTLEQLQRYEDALDSYEKAVNLNPDNLTAIYNRKRLQTQMQG